MEVKKQRFDNIDLLKTFAIFCVILIHSFWVKVDFWIDGSISNYLHYFSRSILATSVPVFFFCTGFLLFRKNLDAKKHIYKTIYYIVITYVWAVLTIYLLMPIKDQYLTIGQVIYYIRTWEIGWINHLWFMGPLVCIYVIFPLLKLAAEHDKRWLLYFNLIVIVCTMGEKAVNMLLTVKYHQSTVEQFADLMNPFTGRYDWAYVYFSLGGIVSVYYEKITEFFSRNRKKWNIICAVIFLSSCLGLFAYGVFMSKLIYFHWNLAWEGYDTLFIVSAVLALYGLSMNYQVKSKNLFTRIIEIISKNTLGIYFIHMVFVTVTQNYFAESIFENNFLVLLIYVAAILGVSTLITLGVKKIPVLNQLVK